MSKQEISVTATAKKTASLAREQALRDLGKPGVTLDGRFDRVITEGARRQGR